MNVTLREDVDHLLEFGIQANNVGAISSQVQALQNIKNMQVYYSSSLQTVQPQQHAPNQAVIGDSIAVLLIIVLPSCLALGAFLYRKSYRLHRTTVRLQQVATLERRWQMSPKK